MNYIFCPAYRSLFFALYLKNLGKEIAIVTYNKDIKKYCIATNIDYLYFEVLRPGIISFYKGGTLKKRLDILIEKIDFGKEDCFYLLDNAIAYEGFYLAKELSKKGVAYFKNTARELKIYKPKFNRVFLEKLVTKYLLNIFLGLDLIFYDTNNVPRFGINDKFIEKYNIIKIAQDQDFDDLILDVVKKSKVNQKEYENLIISEGPGIINILKYDSIKNVYKNLVDLPLEFAFKKHPDPIKAKYPIEVLYEELFKNCKEIPDYVPVELFFNNTKKNVVAIMSASLITASQLEHLKVISLLELVEWYHQSYKNEAKDYLTKASKNRILFVKDFEELKEIL
jgi:hypothetical protein